MTLEDQRIAIAEMRRIVVLHHLPRAGGIPGNGRHIHQLLDYLNDPNAMHEAENVTRPL